MTEERLRYGGRISREDGLPVQAVDRQGTVWLQAGWDEGELLQARLRIPDHREVVIRPRRAVHPVLGPCHEVTVTEGPVGTAPEPGERHASLFEAVDLVRPDHIPAMDRPGALPGGAGTAILNLVAWRAKDQGVESLRYRGPYPTGALFDALMECFVVQAPVEAAGRFVQDSEAIALQARPVEVPVDFRPAPFERVWPRPEVCVQLREGVERVWIEGRGFSRLTAGARQIRAVEHGERTVFEAALVLGGVVWGTVAVLGEDGEVLDGPLQVPPPPERLMDAPLPASVRRALVDALPPRAPRLLQDALRDVLEQVPMRWGDPGLDVAAVREGALVLHGGLLEVLATAPPARILEALAEAVDGPARLLALQRVKVSPPSP